MLRLRFGSMSLTVVFLTTMLLTTTLTLAGCVGDLTMESGGPPASSPPPTPDLSDVDAGLAPPVRPDASTPPTPASDAGVAAPDARAPALPDAGPSAPPSELSAAEIDLLRAINDERASLGLAPVEIDMRLVCAARRHALDVGASGSCGHVGSDGSWPWDRAEACGFPQERWTVNEIAAGPGFSDGADAVWGWSHSDGHYAALTHERAATVGVAVHETCFIALFDCCVAGSE